MTADEKKALITDLRQLAKAIESGRDVAAEKLLISNIAVRLLDAFGAGAMVKNMVVGFFK